jgi:hypothetical protein
MGCVHGAVNTSYPELSFPLWPTSSSSFCISAYREARQQRLYGPDYIGIIVEGLSRISSAPS